MTQQRSVIVTGIGIGIGQATAAVLKAAGASSPPCAGRTLRVAAWVAEVMKRTGWIDAIVNNAGVDMVGMAKKNSISEGAPAAWARYSAIRL